MDGIEADDSLKLCRRPRSSVKKTRPGSGDVRSRKTYVVDGVAITVSDDSSLCDSSDNGHDPNQPLPLPGYEKVKKRKRKSKTRRKGAYNTSESSDTSSRDSRQKRKQRTYSKDNDIGRCRRRRRGKRYIESADDDSDDSLSTDSDEIPEDLHYRSNVQAAISEIRGLNLSAAHLEAVKRTPFWYFVEAALSMSLSDLQAFKKHDGTTVEIVRRYNCSSFIGKKGFMFGDKVFRPRRSDMELIFGIRGGRDPINVLNTSIELNEFIERCFPEKAQRIIQKTGGEYLLKKTLIKRSLASKIVISNPDITVCEDVARLVHLYLLSVLFVPNQNNLVPWHMTTFLVDFERLCMYDWAGYILKFLMTAIKKANQYKVGGCSIFLLFWLCEITHIIKPRDGNFVFPRFLKWNLRDLKRKLMRRNIDGFFKDSGLSYRLVPRSLEIARLDGDVPGMDCLPSDTENGTAVDQLCSSEVPSHMSQIPNECSRELETNICKSQATCSDVVDAIVVAGCSEHITKLADQTDAQADGVEDIDVAKLDDQVDVPAPSNISPEHKSDHSIVVSEKTPMISLEGKNGNSEKKDFSWIDFLDSDLPSFTLMSPDSGTGTEILATPEQGGSVVRSPVMTFRKSAVNDVDLLMKENEELIHLRGEVIRLQEKLDLNDALDLGHQLSRQTLQLTECETKIVKLEAELKGCESARSRLVNKLTMLEQGLSESEQGMYQYRNLYEKERVQNIHLDAANALNVEELDIQKARITELILENDFLRVEVKRLKDSIEKLESNMCSTVSPHTQQRQVLTNLNGKENEPLCTPLNKAIVCYNTPLKPSNLFRESPSTDSIQLNTTKVKSSTSCVSKQENHQQQLAVVVGNTNSNSSNIPVVDLVTPPCTKMMGSTDGGNKSVIVICSCSPVTDSVKLARHHELVAIEAIEKIPKSHASAGVTPILPLKNSSGFRAIKLNRHKEAVQYLDIVATTWYANQFKIIRDRDPILKLMTSYATSQISLTDIEVILNHERFNESIMDTWALLIQHHIHGQPSMKDTRRNVGAKPFLFRSFCWQYVACSGLDSSYKRGCEVFVHDKIPDAINYDHWLIPLNTTTSSTPHDTTGDNWTLLHYDIASNYWTHYNSMPAQRIELDLHLRASNILINFIEDRIRQYCNATGRRLPVYFASGQVGSFVDTPRQPRNSLDCGTVMCSVIEKLISGKPVTSSNWSTVTAGKYRAHMAKTFYDAIIKRAA